MESAKIHSESQGKTDLCGSICDPYEGSPKQARGVEGLFEVDLRKVYHDHFIQVTFLCYPKAVHVLDMNVWRRDLLAQRNPVQCAHIDSQVLTYSRCWCVYKWKSRRKHEHHAWIFWGQRDDALYFGISFYFLECVKIVYCKSRAIHTVDECPKPSFPTTWYRLDRTSPLQVG